MPKTIALDELPQNLDYLKASCDTLKEPIYLTHHGKTVLVMQSIKNFEQPQKDHPRMDALDQEEKRYRQELHQAILAGFKEIEQGNYVTLEEAQALRNARLSHNG